jgi:DNA polymerase III epsilon subunit-like protein
MRAVILDTETTGIPKWDLPADHEQQPRMAQLAATLVDSEARVVEAINKYVLPDTWSDYVRDPRNCAEAFAVNGLSLEFLEANGEPLETVLEEYDRLVDDCELIVGFSLAFDQKIVRGEQRRTGRDDRYGFRPTFDVQYPIRQHLGVKSIKLIEAVPQLLERDPTEPHKAHGDVADTVDLYAWCLEQRLVVPKPQETRR